MGWILQGSPKRFDVDDYVTRYPFVYWSAPTNQKDLKLGDRVFIWRSGAMAGVIAAGFVRERPVPSTSVKHPEALGDDLWTARQSAPSDVKVGVEANEVRLTPDEGMVSRSDVKAHPLLGNHRIITQRQGTVFRLTSDETGAMESLWGTRNLTGSANLSASAMEGASQLHAHYRRERSHKLAEQKREHFRRRHGKLFCEVCLLSAGERYPAGMGEAFIEVHHLLPLSVAMTPVRTTLDHLILVCANCHRLIHRTRDYARNTTALRKFFENHL